MIYRSALSSDTDPFLIDTSCDGNDSDLNCTRDSSDNAIVCAQETSEDCKISACEADDNGLVCACDASYNSLVCVCDTSDSGLVCACDASYNSLVCVCDTSDSGLVCACDASYNSLVCVCDTSDSGLVCACDASYNSLVCACDTSDSGIDCASADEKERLSISFDSSLDSDSVFDIDNNTKSTENENLNAILEFDKNVVVECEESLFSILELDNDMTGGNCDHSSPSSPSNENNLSNVDTANVTNADPNSIKHVEHILCNDNDIGDNFAKGDYLSDHETMVKSILETPALNGISKSTMFSDYDIEELKSLNEPDIRFTDSLNNYTDKSDIVTVNDDEMANSTVGSISHLLGNDETRNGTIEVNSNEESEAPFKHLTSSRNSFSSSKNISDSLRNTSGISKPTSSLTKKLKYNMSKISNSYSPSVQSNKHLNGFTMPTFCVDNSDKLDNIDDIHRNFKPSETESDITSSKTTITFDFANSPLTMSTDETHKYEKSADPNQITTLLYNVNAPARINGPEKENVPLLKNGSFRNRRKNLFKNSIVPIQSESYSKNNQVLNFQENKLCKSSKNSDSFNNFSSEFVKIVDGVTEGIESLCIDKPKTVSYMDHCDCSGTPTRKRQRLHYLGTERRDFAERLREEKNFLESQRTPDPKLKETSPTERHAPRKIVGQCHTTQPSSPPEPSQPSSTIIHHEGNSMDTEMDPRLSPQCHYKRKQCRVTVGCDDTLPVYECSRRQSECVLPPVSPLCCDSRTADQLSERELDTITRLHTICNSQRRVTYLSYDENASLLVQHFPPPKQAERIQWTDGTEKGGVAMKRPHQSHCPKPILSKRQTPYPYSEETPSPILLTRLRKILADDTSPPIEQPIQHTQL